MELNVRGLLFDMDGVLMSSLGSVERSWKRYADFRDLDPDTAVKMAHGRRAIETVRALRPDLDSDAETAAPGGGLAGTGAHRAGTSVHDQSSVTFFVSREDLWRSRIVVKQAGKRCGESDKAPARAARRACWSDR